MAARDLEREGQDAIALWVLVQADFYNFLIIISCICVCACATMPV